MVAHIYVEARIYILPLGICFVVIFVVNRTDTTDKSKTTIWISKSLGFLTPFLG